ncbi:MAG: sigma 54-interacting transcriptional regulator [Deltaproteobacteria bacterium]|jgi:transcriptional regulator with GAF, ATPase, and Fis domain|nr:sigma 54-interacting transcriptional regulator [Deltaproteobacteria bacterium]
MQPLPAWPEIGRLHVVRNIAGILARRWQLGVGWAHPEETFAPTAADPEPPLCSLVHERDPGLAGCQNNGAAMLATLEPDRGVVARRCQIGLVELAAPIVVDGEVAAALLCGGFVREGSHQRDLASVDRRTRELTLESERYRQARGQLPVLTASEEAFVSDLLLAAAADVSAYLEQRPIAPVHLDGPRDRFDRIVGSSPAMQELYSLLDRVVTSDSTILVQGENGTGKELVARAIHGLSSRRNKPFVVQNCSAFNDNLLDSELFGHKRGAFTGAVGDKPGLFEVADGGTFFLDEIGDMSPALQVKVLRVLQEGTFTPVGDTVEKKVDVRIIAATNRDLKAMIESGEFREDLYYRINVINLVIPPLRRRGTDIELLARTFLERHKLGGQNKTLAVDTVDRLRGHRWPGNVRELENEIERAVVLSGTRSEIRPEDLSERVREATGDGQPDTELDSLPLPKALRTLERRMILAALRNTGWNKTRAAAQLEISRRNLIRLVHKYELEALRPAKRS